MPSMPSTEEDAKTLEVLYKRRGYFDAKRDELLQQFKQTDTHAQLLEMIKSIVDEIVQTKPELLLKNKGQLAALIEGIILRQNSAAHESSLTNFGIDVSKLSNHDNYDVYQLFEKQVKSSTEGSEELRNSLIQTLHTLRREKLPTT
ncbi:unnamed protein product [Cyberlindnera jadinii]|uniref:BOD1/SHG1 domain-containing protein n=1 Tax=Cyberlindnera jadinii (strain ATCC 18201 / CBS 1600 / BCRC 20928 / JCM 3617 / NBRC 0987 / NRRL Y-1542) TaxID=983966 RepID=A0A0H5C9G0_CYBJN|nr:unnamed protein product [Cyberlindnera jadinii]